MAGKSKESQVNNKVNITLAKGRTAEVVSGNRYTITANLGIKVSGILTLENDAWYFETQSKKRKLITRNLIGIEPAELKAQV